jgi:hypothetical protein
MSFGSTSFALPIGTGEISIHSSQGVAKRETYNGEDTRETVALFPILDEHTWHVLVCLVREKILVVSFCFLT